MKCGYCKKEKKTYTKEHVRLLLNHRIDCDLSFRVEVCAACKKKLAGGGIPQAKGSRLVLVV